MKLSEAAFKFAFFGMKREAKDINATNKQLV
jgi:hypothetical protein